MTNLDAAWLNGADHVLDAFGEEITVTPNGGSGRLVDAVVDRNPPRIQDEAGRGMTVDVDIIVKNVATGKTADNPHGGYSSAEVDTGGDTVTLAMRIGAAPQERPIRGILDQDEGMVRYAIG